MIVLSFDIERSGAMSQYDTIAIGASVLFYDSNNNDIISSDNTNIFKELDRFSYGCYNKIWTIFEQRCYDQFWSKNLDILQKIEYKGNLQTKQECEYEMINLFQEFRKKWEKYADDSHYSFVLVSDNKVYDGGFINDLIFKYLKDILPIPYSALKQEYETFIETHSMQIGLLFNHGLNVEWGTSKKIIELYNVPLCPIIHNNNPTNDAMTIAWDYLILFCISKNLIKLK